MKFASALFGVCVLLLAAVLFYQHQFADALRTEMAALTSDRDDMKRELKQVQSLIAELQARAAADAAAARLAALARENPRAGDATAASVPVAAPVAPVARPGVTTKAPAGWAKNGAKPDQYVVGVDANEAWGGMPSA
jgi:septal ring factor EnvC (AmiA/AmiB activator)